jgi:intracellular multiplication protein IcmP
MAGGGNQRVDDAELTIVLMVGIFLVLCWGIWVGAKQPLMEVIRWVKWTEITVFQLIDPNLAKDRKLLEDLKNDQATIDLMNKEAEKMRPKRELMASDFTARGLLAPDVLWDASNSIGYYTRWPIALLLGGYAFYLMFISKKTMFRTPHELEGLIKLQAKHWPIITPIVNFSPTEANARNPGEPVPKKLPLFSEALSPEEWVAHNQIALINKTPEKDGLRRAFQQQMGSRWTGIGCLTPAQRCLFAAFSLKGAQKRQESDDLLGRIALAWDHKTDFTPSAELMAEVNRIINDPKLGGEALKIAGHFAYRTTALLGVLKWGRDRGGVLAPAAFLWLRGHDRALWYPLNNLGRRSYHSEAAGAMAHFMAEAQAGKAENKPGRPLPVPRLETAILAILQYWSDPNKHHLTNGIPVVPELAGAEKKKGFL